MSNVVFTFKKAAKLITWQIKFYSLIFKLLHSLFVLQHLINNWAYLFTVVLYN